MAIHSQASDIITRERIWVSYNPKSKRGRQLNSHTSDCYNRDQTDGFPAAELAGLYTDYSGNGWQEKYQDFIQKWADSE